MNNQEEQQNQLKHVHDSYMQVYNIKPSARYGNFLIGKDESNWRTPTLKDPVQIYTSSIKASGMSSSYKKKSLGAASKSVNST